MADASVPVEAIAIEIDVVEIEAPDLETRLSYVDDWEESTADSLQKARRDRDYHDNIQWTEEEIAELEKRGQPVITKNRIARKVNFVLGEEIKKRVDPVCRPRTPQHEDAARAATDGLRFVEEEQDFDFVRSAVLKDTLVAGLGGALKSIEQGKQGVLHRLKHIEWNRLFWDPRSRATDFADARYLGVILWMDLDDAIADYPDAEEALRAACNDGGSTTSDATEDTPRQWVSKDRKRVKLTEMYLRVGDNWLRSVFTKGADIKPPAPTGHRSEEHTS